MAAPNAIASSGHLFRKQYIMRLSYIIDSQCEFSLHLHLLSFCLIVISNYTDVLTGKKRVNNKI